EVAWNDDSSQYGLSSSGGGVSTFYTSKPAFQTGVPGIPADSKRDVPDISLYSSPDYPGYLYCTSDQSDWGTTQTGSCGSGFRASSSDTTLTVAGGTSFAAPIFAGMMAIINEKANFPTGQGNINTKLYALAANSVTYAAAFHDVTSGNNKCTAGSTYCASGTVGYSAGVGYDQVTGLGSVDLDKLAIAWTGGTSALIGTTTTVAASNGTPALNANDTFTITVAPVTGATVPSGTVALSVDGGALINETLSNNGTYAYVTAFATTGGHSVVAQYLGDTTHAASTGVATVTVPGGSSGTGTFTLTPSNASTGSPTLTVAQGSAGSETLTVTPAGGYTGTVYLTFDTSNDTALANLCYGFTTTLSNGDGSVSVTSPTTAVTTQLTLDTLPADCGLSAPHTGGRAFHRLGGVRKASNNKTNPAPFAITFAGLLLAGFLGRGSRKFRSLAAVIALLTVGLAISSCGGGSSGGGGGGGGGGASEPPKGTYTITVFGQDSASANITAQTTYSFTID
ncbi:MAG: Ig-like domain repeat protein, partial [Terracidiphilus sp.]